MSDGRYALFISGVGFTMIEETKILGYCMMFTLVGLVIIDIYFWRQRK
jgi:short subunit fatty acids transporter